jgi:uncharacterized protein (DUF302 family)
MQYQPAGNLGALHQQLGIPAKARMHYQLMTDGPLGVYIWDLDSGNTFIVVQQHDHNPILPGRRQLPAHVTEIIAATDDDLKQRWTSTMGWDEVRETLFSELNFRGISVLELDLQGGR